MKWINTCLSPWQKIVNPCICVKVIEKFMPGVTIIKRRWILPWCVIFSLQQKQFSRSTPSLFNFLNLEKLLFVNNHPILMFFEIENMFINEKSQKQIESSKWWKFVQCEKSFDRCILLHYSFVSILCFTNGWHFVLCAISDIRSKQSASSYLSLPLLPVVVCFFKSVQFLVSFYATK